MVTIPTGDCDGFLGLSSEPYVETIAHRHQLNKGLWQILTLRGKPLLSRVNNGPAHENQLQTRGLAEKKNTSSLLFLHTHKRLIWTIFIIRSFCFHGPGTKQWSNLIASIPKCLNSVTHWVAEQNSYRSGDTQASSGYIIRHSFLARMANMILGLLKCTNCNGHFEQYIFGWVCLVSCSFMC